MAGAIKGIKMEVKDIDMSTLSPMMVQYLDVKKNYEGAILMYRVGDFYEMFFDDAKLVSDELELVLTRKECGQKEPAPMCGIPYHAAETYISKLVKKGFKVAVCDQTEDPKKAKGLVKREVTKIITPGTATEGSILQDDKNNWLCVVYYSEKALGICFSDVSDGIVKLSYLTEELSEETLNLLVSFSPSEIIVNEKTSKLKGFKNYIKNIFERSPEIRSEEYFSLKKTQELIKKQFGENALKSLDIDGKDEAQSALGVSLSYLFETQKSSLLNITSVELCSAKKLMHLNAVTRRNLELTENIRGGASGTLLWALGRPKTPGGRRLLRRFIEEPLYDAGEITRRQNAVREMFSEKITRENIIFSLNSVKDISRIMGRIQNATANAKDLIQLRFSLEALPEIKSYLKDCKSTLLKNAYNSIDELPDMLCVLIDAIADDPPMNMKDGGYIKDGFNSELDELREISGSGNATLEKLTVKERERTGISKLKVGYNKIFGYFIEVPNSFKELVPEEYIRKQTLVNAERFITPMLKDIENKILGAKERQNELEREIFNAIREKLGENYYRIKSTSDALDLTDVVTHLASLAEESDYVCPEITTEDVIEFKSFRHPVVEKTICNEPFVPNDVYFDGLKNRVMLITGPNMAGKSTYMRAAALIVVMAQIGSFVPAKYARLSLCDGVFTRVGASDDLNAGQSTFMVEMKEVSEILQQATEKSFIIYDEIGRGTSTFDGMAIARAVLEYTVDRKKLGAKTMFATHYHELTELSNEIFGISNFNVNVKKRNGDIIFLRKISKGAAPGSYGVDVARLAGVPKEITDRANKILKELEENGTAAIIRNENENENVESVSQISFESNINDEIGSELKELDINTLTPLEALQLLGKFKEKAEKG